MEDFNKKKTDSKSKDSERVPPPSGEPEGADDYYFNANGLMVLTASYLLERGYCCGNGCTNCPYNYKAVPEPRRSQLLKKRKEEGYSPDSTIN